MEIYENLANLTTYLIKNFIIAFQIIMFRKSYIIVFSCVSYNLLFLILSFAFKSN